MDTIKNLFMIIFNCFVSDEHNQKIIYDIIENFD